MRNSGSRCIVSGVDGQIVNAIANHLKKMGVIGSVCKLDSLSAGLGAEYDGMLILTVASVVDAREVRRQVQAITLQRWPVTVLVVATETAAASGELNCLHGRVSGQFQWPRDAAALARFTKKRFSQESRPISALQPSLPEVICREFLGMTPALWPLADQLAAAVVQDINVLITGETGTGKSFLARVIHECSHRKDHGFIVVPCGALVPSLIQSELFGHTQGAFTGAERVRVGRFAAAGKGTLLLDEIEALGLEQQASLLRVIETGEFEPVGSTETQMCSARIIAASTVNLEKAAQAGRFRSDLYYRLAGMAFHLPPLRERVEDVPRLARGMVARFNRKFNKGLFDISPDLMATLQAMPWPGNLRQLESALLQAVLYSTGSQLTVEHFLPSCPATTVGPRRRN
jgi:two-component system response regulator HydG